LVCLYAKALWKTVAAEYGLRRMLKKRRRFATALIYYFKYIYMQNLDLLVAIGNIMLTQKKELSILLMMKNRLMTLGISIALILSLILSGTVASVMGYYDGNTVTDLWNYAQHFALNDNFFDTTFGPSTPAR